MLPAYAEAWLEWVESVQRVPQPEERIHQALLRYPQGASEYALRVVTGVKKLVPTLDRMAAKDRVQRLYMVDVVCGHVNERDRKAAQQAAMRRVEKLRRQGRNVRSVQADEQRWVLTSSL